MKPSPKFISIDKVLRIHAIAIDNQGGDSSIRDRALLESALAMPAQQFDGQYLHPDIPAMAAAYAFHICKNHPFVDGNKRASVAAMIVFLSDNGWNFDATADEAEPVFLDLASGVLDKVALTDWVGNHIHEKPKMELREFFAKLTYKDIAECIGAMRAHDQPNHAHKERFDTIMEAGNAIPAIHAANLGAMERGKVGDQKSAEILLAQSQLLTVIYRIAQDMGYEW